MGQLVKVNDYDMQMTIIDKAKNDGAQALANKNYEKREKDQGITAQVQEAEDYWNLTSQGIYFKP